MSPITLWIVLGAIVNYVSCQTAGNWVSCIGTPPRDVFKTPEGIVPSFMPKRQWSHDGYGYGRGGAYQCRMWVYQSGSEREYVSDTNDYNQYKILLNTEGLLASGQAYAWANWQDYIYKRDSYVPIVAQELKSHDAVFCIGKNIQVTCNYETSVMNLAGQCNLNGQSYFSYCGQGYQRTTQPTDQVLVFNKVARREVLITKVSDITATMVSRKPNEYLQDKTINGGSTQMTWEFSKTYRSEQTSSFESLYGWKLGVSTTFGAGDLVKTVQNWQVSINAEANGQYTTTKSETQITETAYKKTFNVPKKVQYEVKVTIFKETIDVPYEAVEVFYDDKNKELGRFPMKGTWHGVSTFAGNTEIKETKL